MAGAIVLQGPHQVAICCFEGVSEVGVEGMMDGGMDGFGGRTVLVCRADKKVFLRP